MNRRLNVLVVALATALAGCSGVRDAIRSERLPAPTRFEPAELVDVLVPGAVPAIDRPTFETADLAAERLTPDHPVVVLEIGGDARAYPVAILVWHEIVNDTVGGEAVAVTYSPLADAAVAFRRRAAGRLLSFGGSGKLYRSNLVLYDRTTTTLWPQLVGAAVAGPLTGSTLERVPVQTTSFEEFRAAYPNGRVLTAATGAARVYGASPYAGYDRREGPSDSFFARPIDPRLDAMERVVGVTIGGESRAYPFRALAGSGAINDRVGGTNLVVLWRPGTRSALDSPLIADGRDIGSAGVFLPEVDGVRLDLVADAAGIRDRQTGSAWSVLGVATAGRLKGKRLAPVEHVNAFWFAWAAFVPATTVFQGS